MPAEPNRGLVVGIVDRFLRSNLSIVLILLSLAVGGVALTITPREEEPQIVVPLADVFVSFPGRSAREVEQLVATPLEKLLYQIDGVEHVYSMSRPGQAVVTVRFYVGQDRERSLVKLYNKIEQNTDMVPPGVTGWTVKPVEIDDVPIVTLTLTGASETKVDDHRLRRLAEELAERLAQIADISRIEVVGGRPRQVRIEPNVERLAASSVSLADVERALRASNVTLPAGWFTQSDRQAAVETGGALAVRDEVADLVVGVFNDRPVFLKDVAAVHDGPAEAASYVRFGRGPAWDRPQEAGAAGSVVGPVSESVTADAEAAPAVTLAVAKKKGTNAVRVAEQVIEKARELRDQALPDDVAMIVTRNYGRTADEKVNELVEALGVAVVIVIALLAFGLGWRQALVVALAVPIVFGLTLTVNLLVGYTINRVTMFALILSLGLLVDDPIVDVENIHRHFGLRKRATRKIVLEAVNEVRPPLIAATVAVIVSFLPMLFITGMMGPYMRPMALNVPVTMLMSMVVSFTITPWLAYHLLKHGWPGGEARGADGSTASDDAAAEEEHSAEEIKRSALYRLFHPMMAPLITSRWKAWVFLGCVGVLLVVSAILAATRDVPLKMLPFDNKNELLLVLDFDEGTTLERSDAVVRRFESFLQSVPEVVGFTSYVGVASPMDFNGLVRHYYLRQDSNMAEVRINLVPKKERAIKSHALGLRLRDRLDEIAREGGVNLKIVETPPGPPVISTVVAEVFGRPDHTYNDLLAAAGTVRQRLEREPGVVDVDDVAEAEQTKWVFAPDKTKAAINGVGTDDIASALQTALGGSRVGTLWTERERNPLALLVRLPRAERSSLEDLSRLSVKGVGGNLVALGELGAWSEQRVDQTIYHKDLRRVAYVFAETAGRAPADAVVDIQADRVAGGTLAPQAAEPIGAGWVATDEPRDVGGRTFLANGGGVDWMLPEGFDVVFSGEGEWKITLDVFRDLGLAFAAALVMIYILLLNETGSFTLPVVVMLAIPLTVVGIMPGFWLLNVISGGSVGGYADPIFFTATGMIGMIALAGIVTRDSIILVDFIHISLRRGRNLFDAIMESRVVRLRPILLTTGTAMLSAAPIALDPIFSGLAWALIFGLFASTVFTLFVIPVAYFLLYGRKPGHGVVRWPDES
ncbi:MAG TPA: efflux RND transporter permease subunit [Phycisphaerae bacterium]|nr:efflux RND transporter permease subunit [Phycisphaerae bacterium]